MSEYEAIVSGFLNRAERIRSMSQSSPPGAQAQLLAIADQYETHANALLARVRVETQAGRSWLDVARRNSGA